MSRGKGKGSVYGHVTIQGKVEECLFKNLKLIKFKTEDIFLSNLQCENKNVTIKTLILSNFNRKFSNAIKIN